MRKLILAAVLSASVVPMAAQAHRAWILPGATVLSANEPWVTFDAAVSNDIFHTDWAALRLGESLVVLNPQGNKVEAQNLFSGRYRTVFDLQLSELGTYRVFTNAESVSASWKENGEQKNFPGRRPAAPVSQADVLKAIPKGAKEVQVTQNFRRNETFVTNRNPTDDVLKAQNKGFEFVPVTHPNDLYAGEEAVFSFLIEGKPAVGAEVEIIPGARRYRDAEEAIILKTDKHGKIAVTWPQAGMYYMEVSYRDDKGKKPITHRAGRYVATFEVLP